MFLASTELNFSYMDIKNCFIVVLFCLLSGCGSDSESVENDYVSAEVMPNAFGNIIDSKVIGLKYKSGEYNGITDENGGFGYILGEQIQFFVGDIAIGYQVEPKEILTPYELANNNSFAALNIARFLQSLDDDSLLDNGIHIHESSHSLAKGKSLDFLSLEWEEISADNSEVEKLVFLLTSNTLSGSRYLVPTAEAYYHFSLTLNHFMGDLITQIVNEIDVTGCTTNNECKIHRIATAFIGYCPPLDAEYIYSETTTDVQKIAILTSERDEIKEIKSSLYNIVDFPRTSGFCLHSTTPQYPSCNDQGMCELSSNFPFD
jgi:hypothetical protein